MILYLFILLIIDYKSIHVQIIVNISMKKRKSVLGINYRYLAFKYKIKSNFGM